MTGTLRPLSPAPGLTIGIMTVNDHHFHPNARFMEEAKVLGHAIELINPYAPGCVVGGSEPDLFFKTKTRQPDIVMPRQGSPMGEYGFVLLNQFRLMGIPLINDIPGVTTARNQYLTLQALDRSAIATPKTCFITARDNFERAVERVGGYPVVAKQVDGMGGDGVVRLEDLQAADRYLAEYLNPKKGLVVQAYIPPENRNDLRVLVTGDTIAGAMSLTPAPGSFKANVHQDGRVSGVTPSKELAAVARAAAKACSLDVAGVDMMIDSNGTPLVVEVNYSPGFRGLEAATGKNIARAILTHVLETAVKRLTP